MRRGSKWSTLLAMNRCSVLEQRSKQRRAEMKREVAEPALN
jgi:hypothetical protein